MTDGAEPREDKDIRLGSLALRAGIVSPDQLRAALMEQAKDATAGKLPRQLGLILVSKGILSEEQLMRLLAEQQRLRTSPRPPA